MDGTEVLSYGLWKSPVTADLLSQQSSIGSIRINESQRKIYAVQTGPDHPAQLVAISCPGSTPHAEDLLPSPYSVGTQVYEYGGGAFAVSRDGRRIVFSDSSTGSVCILDPLDRSVRKCIEQLNRRYADFDIHPVYPHWVCAVEEDISALNHSTTSHALVLLDTASGEVVKLEDQDDFYSQMRFSPDGHQICWLAWSHPHMHFTGAVLYVGKIEQGRLVSKERIGGIPGREAIAQPRWSPAGRLHFLRDRSGFWHLCVYHAQSAESLEIAISGIEHCDMGNPDFGLGSHSYDFLEESRLICGIVNDGVRQLVYIDLISGVAQPLGLPLVHVIPDGDCRLRESEYVVAGSTTTSPTAIYCGDLNKVVELYSPCRDGESTLHPTWVSEPEAFTCARGNPRGLDIRGLSTQDGIIHGFLLRPRNPRYCAPEGTRPPLLVLAHGGPTNHTNPGFSLEQQYWTTRGYTVLLLNYAGSTGYGRTYQTRLNGGWGIVDPDDAACAASFLAQQGLVDSKRMGVVGPSAGGYLSMKTICDHPDIWAAAVSLFGISELRLFAQTTHKFELSYTRMLVNPISLERSEDIYWDRSPLRHAHRIRAPLLLLHGTEDQVVLPEQKIIKYYAFTGFNAWPY